MKFLLYIAVEYGFPIVRPLQEEIKKRGFEVAWFIENENPKKQLNKGENLLATVKDVINYNPNAVIAASNEVPHFFPGIKVQVFHGFSVNKRSKNKGHFRIRGFFDLYCTQGPSTTKHFQELAKKHKHFAVVETGWPKVDILFPVEDNREDKPVIFLASTFTERLSLAHNPNVYKEIKHLIESENWEWIINLHPKMDDAIVEKFKQLGNYNNVTYLPFLQNLKPLKEADVLITDTTSLITEFIIQQKPVITINNNLPQPAFLNITQISELKRTIELALSKPEDVMQKIYNFTLQEHPYFDGKSSERVIDAVVDFYKNNTKKGLKSKPLNLVRKYKICKKLNYFSL